MIAAVAGTVVVIAVVAVSMWRSSGTRWARDVALPEILRLASLDRNGEAFLLATQAETRIAGDPVLNGLWSRISRPVSITTTPTGADVSVRLIGGDTTWHPVGRTPLVNTRLPRGVFWWRFEKAGYEPIEIVRATDFTEVLPGFDAAVALPTPGSHPPGMVAVSIPPRGMQLTLNGFFYYRPVPAPDYYIDRHEVTNAEFKAFVDAGGYEKRCRQCASAVTAVEDVAAALDVAASRLGMASGDAAGRTEGFVTAVPVLYLILRF